MGVPRVILYGHPGCPGSEAARAYCTHHGVPYELRDVSRDPVALAEWRGLGCLATPVLVLGDTRLIGFDPDQFRAAHDRASGTVPHPRGEDRPWTNWATWRGSTSWKNCRRRRWQRSAVSHR